MVSKKLPKLMDSQISKLVGSTKGTVSLIRKKLLEFFKFENQRSSNSGSLFTKRHSKKLWLKLKRQ